LKNIRIGHGFDVHRLVENRPLVIGGVKIEYDKGLDGHSDADVLTHAIMDALLGAATLGDIGFHFPPSDEKYNNADSLELLSEVANKVSEAGYNKIINIDCIIMAEEPKMNKHIPAMIENIFKTLNIDCSQISIKATTTEQLGFVGRKEGIAATAVCLIGSDD
jgi:2-C-methyl-D-erythritol 2,4-cyclodiphosphate synthase